MKKLSIISHFYNHPDMVERQIEHWNRIDPALLDYIEFILVDDHSEELPRIAKSKIDLRLYRVITDLEWNQAGARNLGGFQAFGDWSLYFDIDQRINLDAVPLLLGNLDRLDKHVLYYLRIKELINILTDESLDNHPNSFLTNTREFRTYGMYDEDFVGHYGYEDLYMPRVWERSGRKRGFLSEPIFFEDMGFGTTKLDRNLERNMALALKKIENGCKNAPGILRFEWEQVELPDPT